MIPDKSMHIKGTDCHGTKQNKARITTMFCANMDGSEKCKMAVIGKFKNPHCFKGVHSLPVTYYSQRKAWMDTDLFFKWLGQFDDRYYRQGRKVLLFVDNVSSHKDELTLKATTVKFFPPNTTSKLQPMDQGVIRSCKTHYRRRLLKRLIADIEAGRDHEISLKDGIDLLSRAWDDVKPETVANCFRKAGFKVAEADDTMPAGDEPSGTEGPDSTAESRSVWDFIAREFNLNDVGFDDYVAVDENVPTSDELSDAEIAASVSSAVPMPEDDATNHLTDDPEPPPIPTPSEAWQKFKDIRRFLETSDLDSSTSLALDRMEDAILNRNIAAKMKQTKITDFFP
ncbi:TIGD4 (predicted) [Pycnogonum litorale]